MRKTEVAYLAGVFDGEGCVLISKRKARFDKKEVNDVYTLQVAVGMSDLVVIHLFAKRFGGAINTRKDIRKGSYKVVYTWHLASRKAFDFVKTILPFSRGKKSQLKLALKFYKMCKRQRRGVTIHRGDLGRWVGTSRLPDKDIDTRDSYYLQMKALKKVSK